MAIPDALARLHTGCGTEVIVDQVVVGLGVLTHQRHGPQVLLTQFVVQWQPFIALGHPLAIRLVWAAALLT
ncbi:MAG: hypothetical protein R2932_34425 [Caldilineaceae bacterium]